MNKHVLSHLFPQSDGEPAILRLAWRVRTLAIPEVELRCSPSESSQSYSSAENAGARIGATVSAQLGTVESKPALKIERGSNLRAWAIRHATWALTRYATHGSDRTAACFRRLAANCDGDVVCFGEVIGWRRLMPEDSRKKFSHRFERGAFVGKCEMIDEFLVATGVCVLRTRTIQPS